MPGNTPLQGFRVPVAADDPDVVDDVTQLANGIEKRVMQVYANGNTRDSVNTAPDEGQFAFLRGTDTLTYFDGTAWQTFPKTAPQILSGNTAPAPSLGVNGDVYFQY